MHIVKRDVTYLDLSERHIFCTDLVYGLSMCSLRRAASHHTLRLVSLSMPCRSEYCHHRFTKITNNHSIYVLSMGRRFCHYCDVIMGAMASQITSLTIIYSNVHSGADQRKYQSSASLVFVWGIHQWPAQWASNAENVSIWWHHHVFTHLSGFFSRIAPHPHPHPHPPTSTNRIH